MNDMTRRLVAAAAKKNPDLARRNDSDFHFMVYDAYCTHIVDVVAQGYMNRAVKLWRTFHPDHFNEEGYLKDYDPRVYDAEVGLGQKAMRMAWRVVDRTPELQLDDWRNSPEIVTDPQMKLF